ncbi:MAG: amidase [Oscillatoriaceae cyanobacterium]
MNKTDIAFTPAIQQAQLIRTREISPLELTQIYLERIEQLNPKLGSFFTVTAELALADAKAKTEQLTATNTDNLPPFFGVPTAVKDLNAVAGVPRCCGVAALRQKVEQYDEGVVVRMKQAGFTILGKTATSQLGSLPYTEPPGLPPARNPWNLDYTAGGSSGGAAAAVAAGLCAVAQGSDGGGSIRIPAACCGVVGIKPSRGRVSYAPLGDCLSGIATNGPLGRTVADTAAFLDVISGYITGDPYWLPTPKPSFLEVATAAKPGKLRIAFATNIPPFGEAALPCKQAVEKTAALLESLGHSLEVGCPTVGDLIEPFITVWQTSIPFSGVPPQLLEPMNQWLLEKANTVSSGKYLEAVAAMQIISRRIVAFFDNFDALLLPVTMQPPIRVGEWAELSPEDAFPKIVNWVAPCAPFNASGQPSIAIPAGFNAGVPVGVQIVGRPGDESTIIALAAQIEAASPWVSVPPYGQM